MSVSATAKYVRGSTRKTRLVTQAIKGNVKYASLYARLYGLLEDKINVSGSSVIWNWQPGAGRSDAGGELAAADSETE